MWMESFRTATFLLSLAILSSIILIMLILFSKLSHTHLLRTISLLVENFVTHYKLVLELVRG